MPVVLKIDPQRKVVHSAFYGRITDAELLGHRKRISSDPDFNPQFSDIVDFSGVTDSEIQKVPSLRWRQTQHCFTVPWFTS